MRLNRLLVLKQAKLPFLIVSQFDHMTSSIVDDIYLSTRFYVHSMNLSRLNRSPKMFRTSLRSFSTATRQSIKIGLIPADGIGKEVIPVCSFSNSQFHQSHPTNILQAAKEAIIALGSDIPKPEFIDLVAGWECFTRTGVALPDETVQ